MKRLGDVFKAFRDEFYEELLDKHPYDSKYHLEVDVWTHTMLVFNEARKSNNLNYAVAALLHDVGKQKAKFTDETGRTLFRGHEGISTYMAIDFLFRMKQLNLVDNPLSILYMINYHGMFWQKSEKQLKKLFLNENDYPVYNDVYEFSKFDQAGNISFEFNRENKEKLLLGNLTKNNLKEYDGNKPNCYLLIGIPNSGKSTHTKKYLKDKPVLSRDDLLMEYGKRYGKDLTYSEIWNKLTDTEQKDIDRLLDKRASELKRSDDDFVIDMTNVSWKSRVRHLNGLRNHNPIAVTFLTDYKEIMKRNKIREQEEGKNIPYHVLINMMRRFEMPLFGEGFTKLDFVVNS